MMASHTFAEKSADAVAASIAVLLSLHDQTAPCSNTIEESKCIATIVSIHECCSIPEGSTPPIRPVAGSGCQCITILRGPQKD